MKLFIIGNGFDLGHGLPTRYWDFRTYLENTYPEFLYEFEKHYYIYPRTDDETKKKILWYELEANLANIDEDVIIENAVCMELNLESGDIGIEDTLYRYFSEEYKYIRLLIRYIKQWVRTIRIRDIKKKTSLISVQEKNLYINFNYTSVLENVYGIAPYDIIHIHGSLREKDGEPILGHGNQKALYSIRHKIDMAERNFDEKETSICRALEDYYTNTFKNINKYMYKLQIIDGKPIDEIIVIGHSLSGVDIPYFGYIDVLTHNKAKWSAYYYNESEKSTMHNNLLSCSIDKNRIEMLPSKEFYDLSS